MKKAPKSQEKLVDLLTLTETAALLKVHANTLRAWDRKGILPAVRIGEKRVRRYKKEDILALVQAQ